MFISASRLTSTLHLRAALTEEHRSRCCSCSYSRC